ncbi:hypothetical protein ACFFUB_11455 [Algimonas porphyrae]|uniref:Lipoprotein n=1 Tax=Algimonas porphyrae TaxID=1128113 RepID=A0ABQ5V4T8_9PROT|nr:hypothetical protein [Algimonas porphyrae]GLQ21969.1 hypothetical protein GCM10007854_29240 [Algimonas porphyrae]
MINRAHKGITAAVLTGILLAGCSDAQDPGGSVAVTPVKETPVEQTPASQDVSLDLDTALVPVNDRQIRTGGVSVLLDGRADYVVEPDALYIRFYDSLPMVQVFMDAKPEAGDAYELSLDVEQVAGDYAARVRAIFSRDCSTSGDDFNQVEQQLGQDAGEVTISVPHSFAYPHDCTKMVFQVLNAYPETPLTLRFDPNVATVTADQ